jgi:hypothetical protein
LTLPAVAAVAVAAVTEDGGETLGGREIGSVRLLPFVTCLALTSAWTARRKVLNEDRK